MLDILDEAGKPILGFSGVDATTYTAVDKLPQFPAQSKANALLDNITICGRVVVSC